MDSVRACIATLERKSGKGFGSARKPAARFGAVGFGDVDARHDGHDPQPRPQRGDACRGSPTRPAIGASRGTPTAASSSSTARSRWAFPTKPSTRRWRRMKRKHGAVHDVELTADALQELAEAFLDVYREHTARNVPGRSVRAARTRDPGGVPVVERQARRRLPAPVQDHAGDGQRDCGQCLHDGLRQPGRRFGDRRRLHPQSRRPART